MRGNICTMVSALLLSICAIAGAAEGKPRMDTALQATLSPSRLVYRPGEAVAFKFVVKNTGKEKQTLTFPSGQSYDLTISANGKEIWRWSAGKMFTMAIVMRELGPGEALSSDITWDGKGSDGKPVQDGLYAAKAWLAISGAEKPSAATALGIGKVSPTKIGRLLKSGDAAVGKLVMIRAKLFSPALVESCPPGMTCGWYLKDDTGGITTLGPSPFAISDTGKSVEIIGALKKDSKGQLYLGFMSGQLVRTQDKSAHSPN